MDINAYQYGYTYNFIELSHGYEYLKPFIRENGSYTFSYEGQLALSKAILKDQFNIQFIESPGNLCPPIPSKIAYLKIIDTVLKESRCLEKIADPIEGIDVGTGAYAIYPILAYKLFKWEMIGTDINRTSIAHANKLLEANELENVIKIVENDGLLDHECVFSMCNPPFYESVSEMEQKESFKNLLDHQSVVAADNELITEGGEINLVSKLIEQSKTLRIVWFSSMLGKKSSIEPILSKLKEVNCPNYFLKDYQLGKTKRWVLFWSFNYYRPIIHNQAKNFQYQSTIIEFPINIDKLEAILSKYNFASVSRVNDSIEVITNGDVWSRAYRRRQGKPDPKEKKPKYIFVISKNQIHFCYGDSFKIFQSFHTLIRKQLNT